MSRRDYDPGLRFAIAWLHERAKSMNDPRAKQTLDSAAFALGVEKRGMAEGRPSYDAEVAYVRRTIRQRGHLFEGARPAFESGRYHDENLARMLREGVIVPAPDPNRGYVLPPEA